VDVLNRLSDSGGGLSSEGDAGTLLSVMESEVREAVKNAATAAGGGAGKDVAGKGKKGSKDEKGDDGEVD
jgi:hypothetical protein